MLLFRTVTDTDKIMVVHTPMWIAVLCIGLALAVGAASLMPRWPRPWRLGGLLATIVLLYGGWQMLGNTITFEPRGFYVDGPLGEEIRVGWLQVSGIDQGGLRGAKNAEPGQLAFLLRTGGEIGVDLSGLSPEEQSSVVAFVQKRIKP